MKRLVSLLSIMIVCSGCHPNSIQSVNNQPEQNTIESYVCYYGSYDANLKDYDVAIIESDNLSKNEITALNDAGVCTIAYLTIGEDDALHEGDGSGPGGIATYYLDDGSGNPQKNTDWNSYYVNAGDPAWQNIIINQAAVILDKGCDGLFLDTVDTADIFPETADGMVSLVRLLRETFPDCKLVINRGFGILNSLAPYINGLMFEDFSSTYDFDEKVYKTLTASERKENSDIATNMIDPLCQESNLLIFTLDYCDPQNTGQIKEYYDRSLSFGYIPYCSTVDLDKIYIHTAE